MAASTGHVARITTVAKIGDAIEMVTVPEVPKTKIDNAVPKNIILPKIRLHFIVCNLKRTPKLGVQMED